MGSVKLTIDRPGHGKAVAIVWDGERKIAEIPAEWGDDGRSNVLEHMVALYNHHISGEPLVLAVSAERDRCIGIVEYELYKLTTKKCSKRRKKVAEALFRLSLRLREQGGAPC